MADTGATRPPIESLRNPLFVDAKGARQLPHIECVVFWMIHSGFIEDEWLGSCMVNPSQGIDSRSEGLHTFLPALLVTAMP